MGEPFDGFFGNDSVLAALESMIVGDRLPHAVILEGDAGTGRKTLAHMLARAAACTGEGAPCGACPACLNESNPDIQVILPEKSVISVDQIRGVIRDASVVPNQSRRRTFIIPDAQLMNDSAQNALLKVLEEPPDTVMFVLTCEHRRQLLGTVVSRSTVFTLSAPDTDSAVTAVTRLMPQTDSEAICRAVADAKGNIGAAVELLSGGSAAEQAANDIAAAVKGRSELELLLKCNALSTGDYAFMKKTVGLLCDIFGDALTLKKGSPRRFPEGDVRISLAEGLTAAQLMRLLDISTAALGYCERNVGAAVFAAEFCACLRGAVDL